MYFTLRAAEMNTALSPIYTDHVHLSATYLSIHDMSVSLKSHSNFHLNLYVM